MQYSDIPERNRTIYSLADVIKFNELNPPTEGYNQYILIAADATNGLRNKTYLSALHEYRRDALQYLDSIFDENDVEALATPCYARNTPLLYSYGAAAGYPSITVRSLCVDNRILKFEENVFFFQVPVGTNNVGLPFGICLLGRSFSEAILLKLGYFIEQLRPNGRPVPLFI